MATCITCEEKYSNKRMELGYSTCLDCGQADAVGIMNTRRREKLAEIAPCSGEGMIVLDDEGFNQTVGVSLDNLFDVRHGYDYDWRREVSDSDAVAD
jgi:hypothetical protein